MKKSPPSEIVTSADGTRIAFERQGQGEPLILVDGALCHRGMGPSRGLAALLADSLAVYAYDRRGRGESGDTQPYSIEREVDDLAAILEVAGGSAFVCGMSSGAVLALEAAERLEGVERLALYEAPIIADQSHATTENDWRAVKSALRVGDRGKAVGAFLRSVGFPAIGLALFRMTPLWPKLKAIAPTLAYDADLVEDLQQGRPPDPARWHSIEIPTVVLAGEKSPPWMHNGSRALAAALPNAACQAVPGLTHDIKPRLLAPSLAEFFGKGPWPGRGIVHSSGGGRTPE